MSEPLLYIVGDVHGMLPQFRDLVFNRIPADAAGRPWELVLVGDLVDRGPLSKPVVEDARRLAGGEWPMPSDPPVRVTVLRGNHEDMLLGALASNDGNSQISHWWMGHGGKETMESYGWSEGKPFEIPRAHRNFLASRPRFYETEALFIVHAGCSTSRDLDWHRAGGQAQDDVMLWIRPGFVDVDHDWGKRIVHGHTIARAPDIRPFRLGVDSGCYQTGILTAARFLSGSHADPDGYIQCIGPKSPNWS